MNSEALRFSDPAAGFAPDQTETGRQLSRPTILAVDDDPQVRNFLEKILQRRGYGVVTATDGQDALRILRQGGIDLIVTDLCMPGMDGIELVTNLRRDGGTIPIIAISGALVGHTAEMLRAAGLLGAHLTMQKPFPALRLLDNVDYLIGVSGAGRRSQK